MKHWWEIPTTGQDGETATVRAVAYYRHSAQDRQENSIPIQRDQVCEWAEKHGIVDAPGVTAGLSSSVARR